MHTIKYTIPRLLCGGRPVRPLARPLIPGPPPAPPLLSTRPFPQHPQLVDPRLPRTRHGLTRARRLHGLALVGAWGGKGATRATRATSIPSTPTYLLCNFEEKDCKARQGGFRDAGSRVPPLLACCLRGGRCPCATWGRVSGQWGGRQR